MHRNRMVTLLLLIIIISAADIVDAAAKQRNSIAAGEFVVEPPTLISLGFEWYVQGDGNRNA